MRRLTLCSVLFIGCAFVLFGASVSAADLSNAKCPISGKDVDEDASIEYKDSDLYFCCNGCPKAFQKDTAKFATKANQQLVVTGQAVQEKCPISGGKTKDGTALAVGGVEVSFCCKNCRKKVDGESGDAQLDLVFGETAFGKGFVIEEEDEDE